MKLCICVTSFFPPHISGTYRRFLLIKDISKICPSWPPQNVAADGLKKMPTCAGWRQAPQFSLVEGDWRHSPFHSSWQPGHLTLSELLGLGKNASLHHRNSFKGPHASKMATCALIFLDLVLGSHNGQNKSRRFSQTFHVHRESDSLN